MFKKSEVVEKLAKQSGALYKRKLEVGRKQDQAEKDNDKDLARYYFDAWNNLGHASNAVMDIVESLDIWEDWEDVFYDLKKKAEEEVRNANMTKEEKEHLEWQKSKFPFNIEETPK